MNIHALDALCQGLVAQKKQNSWVEARGQSGCEIKAANTLEVVIQRNKVATASG